MHVLVLPRHIHNHYVLVGDTNIADVSMSASRYVHRNRCCFAILSVIYITIHLGYINKLSIHWTALRNYHSRYDPHITLLP